MRLVSPGAVTPYNGAPSPVATELKLIAILPRGIGVRGTASSVDVKAERAKAAEREMRFLCIVHPCRVCTARGDVAIKVARFAARFRRLALLCVRSYNRGTYALFAALADGSVASCCSTRLCFDLSDHSADHGAFHIPRSRGDQDGADVHCVGSTRRPRLGNARHPESRRLHRHAVPGGRSAN